MNFMTVVGEYFPLILLVLVVASGIVSLIDQVFFKKSRVAAVLKNTPDFKKLSKKERHEKLKGPIVTDYCRSLFPVFLLVLFLRSFVGEFFQIPSASMLPNYLIGDYLVVNKFAYGIRLPIWGTKIIAIGEPKRGDVIICNFPVDTQVDFIKRVVGIPGDHISYLNKKLSINGVPVPMVFEGNKIIEGASDTQAVEQYSENISGNTHGIINMPWRQDTHDFTNIVVPQGEYFVMGDNRDDSEDSRYWGFVDEKYLVGKPEIVVLSIGDQGVRWNRIGHWLN